ncbi:bifunctional chorismate mutase/prephenate dehydratase [Olsenella massiliensis]|uniref:bifunctional chorismate mutase/prephenate dehydratase n=1 Tax=Olsenella massiliensis TaxID=1622075 RepID=UPI00071D306D|nr:prephenate dehydratase domain-containing protein [Olsenella massiliensis]
MEQLEDVRDKIDEIDHALLDLMVRRTELAADVAAYKAAHHLTVLDRARERRVVADARRRVPEDLKSHAAALMELLMEASRTRQGDILGATSPAIEAIDEALAVAPALFPTDALVVTQGVEGAYQQIATERIFSHAQIGYVGSFEGVFEAVEAGTCDFGILPLENSTAGTVNQVYDLMMRHDVHIVRSCRVKVNHNLLAKPGTRLQDVTDVYSHEQAIRQCEAFLATLPGVRVHVTRNTALASRFVAQSDEPGVCALASRECAELYGLRALAKNVQDNDNNYTRFACIAKGLTIYPGADRSSLMLVVRHRPGALYRVLGIFFALDINITKLESRPIPDRDFEFMFYFDVACPAASPAFRRLVKELGDVCEEFRHLGSYAEVS